MNKYVVLVLGLNIRSQNRITMEEQRIALRAVAGELDARLVGDKGSYLVTSHHEGRRVVGLVLDALRAFRSILEDLGALLAEPKVVADALAELTKILKSQEYGPDFDAEDHGIRLDGEVWRAGLALPLFPAELPAPRSLFHRTGNALVFGWTSGGILVAKREAPGVHWGTAVTDPAWRLLRREEHVVLDLTSRSGNVLRELLG